MNREKLWNDINMVSALSEQIEAILDLVQGCDESTDIRSIHCASEMCVTMHEELMQCFEEIVGYFKELQNVREEKCENHDGKN